MSSAAHSTCTPASPASDAPATPMLVIGDESLSDLVDAAARQAGLTPAMTTAASFLIGLGDAWKQTPQIAVARLESLDPQGGGLATIRSMLSAFRRVAEHARLIVIAAPEQEDLAVGAMNCGVDDYLLEPISAQRLARLLHNPDNDATLPPNGGEADPGDPDEPELGDIDMVERLLEGRRGLQKMAVKLVSQRSGIADVKWLAPQESPPPDRVAAAVEMRGQSFGMLHAPADADADELAAWAAWLARWLALEAHVIQMQTLAYRDELTGVWNRRYFTQFLDQTLTDALSQRRQVTLMVFDIDDFKVYNDNYGHGAGDDILRETARLMQASVRSHDVVARIGGDEFAVIFWDADGPRKQGSTHPNDVVKAAQRFQQAICTYRFPKLIDGVQATLTISGGLATFPWDGRTPAELLERADQMALRSKQQGKNAITFGPGATRLCVGGEKPAS